MEHPEKVHVALNGSKVEMTYGDFQSSIQKGEIKPDTLCWIKGRSDWGKAQEVFPDLFNQQGDNPPSLQTPQKAPQGKVSKKAKVPAGGLPIASIPLRIIASVIDAFIFFIAALVLLPTGVGEVILPLLYFLYVALLLPCEWQGTVGMKAMGLKLVDEKGERVISGRAWFRTFLATTISMWILGIGYIWALFSDDNQTLHDLITNTYVVKPEN